MSAEPEPDRAVDDRRAKLERLREQGIECFSKTSGSKGMQVYLPLNTETSYYRTKPFAHGVARLLESRDPELIVSVMRKSERRGKVFIDWSQNDRHKTTIGVHSLRAQQRPTVSTPTLVQDGMALTHIS